MVAMVPPDVYAERMQTCSGCYLFEAGRGVCKGCGCFMVIKARAGHNTCPLGLWGSWKPVEA